MFEDEDPMPGRVVAFGASGGLVHPASGFSVAAALRQAWADVPDSWCCPDCGVREKVDFVPVDAGRLTGS